MKSLIVTRAKDAKGGAIVATPSDERAQKKISAGLAENKFRVALSRAREDYDFADRIWLYVTSDCGSLSVRSGQAGGNSTSKREDGRCCLRSIMK